MYLLHQLLHFPHLALEKAVHADFAAVGKEGDGGEAGDGRMDEHAGDGLVRHELRVMVQQRRHLDGDTLVSEDDGRREQDVGFRNTGSLKDSHNQ